MNKVLKFKIKSQEPYIIANDFLSNFKTSKLHKSYHNKSLFFYIIIFFYNLLKYLLAIILKHQKINKNNFKKLNKILLISHLININKLKKKDFYFYKIESLLKKKNIKFNLIQINHTEAIVPNTINYYMTLNDEIKLLKKLIISFLKLIKILFLKKNIKISFKVKIAILANHLSNQTAKNLRIPLQILNIIERNSFTLSNLLIITTYEGYTWEKILFYFLNSQIKKKLNVKICGYQHAFVSNSNFNFYNLYNYSFNPDYLFFSGRYLYKKIIKNTDYKNISFLNLGSSKYSETFLNFTDNKMKDNNILFLPSSELNEIKKLLTIIIFLSKKNPEFTFIWRAHPHLNFDFYKKIKNFPNIKISKDSLSGDINSSILAFYSSSSSIIPAIIGGIRPIYINSNLDDPLEDIKNNWKISIFNYQKININNYIKFNSLIKNDRNEVISQFKYYFEKFKSAKFLSFINENVY